MKAVTTFDMNEKPTGVYSGQKKYYALYENAPEILSRLKKAKKKKDQPSFMPLDSSLL